MAIRSLLGLGLEEAAPDHSTISRTRRLIDLETHREVFPWVQAILAGKGLLKGKTVGIDATTLEANAAMRSIVRRDTGEKYDKFLARLAKESGIKTPSRAALARLDRRRRNMHAPTEVVADKGYHSDTTLLELETTVRRTYISEPDRGRRRWRDRGDAHLAVYSNRRRIRGKRGQRLLSRRGERIERLQLEPAVPGADRAWHPTRPAGPLLPNLQAYICTR